MRCVLEVFTNTYGVYGARETLLGVARVGLRHMELGLWSDPAPADDPLAIIGDNTPTENIAELAALAAEKGVRIISAFGHADLRQAEGLKALVKQLDIAVSLGARYYTVSAPERSKVVYDHLLQLADEALARGAVVCLETHPPLVPSAASGLKTLRELKHSNIRINFDTANPYYYNAEFDMEAELTLLAPYVAHVHLKESRKRYQDWYFPALGEGEGCIDFTTVFRILEQVGFRGPFSLELEGIEGEERTLALHHSRVVKSLEYLKALGLEW
jgi:L-ribulose-5-phosphate 3-epimerase